MSEYQYYEFQAIDRPLTKIEMADLRSLSTRADITSTRFVNVYHFGDFRGDPQSLMETYFDAFVYVANWGTHWCMFRLPRPLLDLEIAARYCPDDDVAALHTTGDHVILALTAHDDGMTTWEESGERWMPSLLPLRDELADGDLRALYLGWLLCAHLGAIEDDEPEPPVPPGLGQPSAALQSLMEFLRIDEDLLAVAAERSAPLRALKPSAGDLRHWIVTLAERDKDDLLLRLLEGNERNIRAELSRRFRQENAPAPSLISEASKIRTVGDLIAAAEERTEARQRREIERKKAERAAFLDDVFAREDSVWRQVEGLIEEKHAAA